MVRPVRLALLFGVLAAAIFVGNTTLLGALLPDYDPISQTISEIGERGSPFETVFMAAELAVAACLLVFALGLGAYASATARSIVPAILLGSYGLANVGTAVFEAPHPLHNVFGISMTLGFLAPLALGLMWSDAADIRMVRRVSAVLGAALLIAIGFNLSPVFIHFAPGDFVRENYGVIQRLLLVPFHLWCGFLAIGLLAARANRVRGTYQ